MKRQRVRVARRRAARARRQRVAVLAGRVQRDELEPPGVASSTPRSTSRPAAPVGPGQRQADVHPAHRARTLHDARSAASPCEHVFVSILHADADCFFASVEQRDEPRLRGRPLVVATWVVMAASYEARAFGVRSAMHARSRRTGCARTCWRWSRAARPTPRRAASCSRSSTRCRRGSSATGSEEAFLEGPPELGGALRRRVRDEVGLPVTVGVASTKIAAKMASRAAKPDGLLVLAARRRARLPRRPPRSSSCGGSGGRRRRSCTRAGSRRSARPRRSSELELVALLGRGNGRRVHALVNNRDRTPVERGGPPRSFGSTRSLGRDDDPPRALEAAAERVAQAAAVEREGGPDDHAAPALRRPHAGRALAHPAGRDGRRDDDPPHGRDAARHAAPADADRRQRRQPRGGG